MSLNMADKRRRMWLELLDWSLVNLVIPFILPLIMVWFVNHLFCDPPLEFGKNLIIYLYECGVYVFLGLFFLLSLFEDYRGHKKAFGLIFTVMLSVGCFVMGLIFAASILSSILPSTESGTFLGITPKPLYENTEISICITAILIFWSIWMKYRILTFKYKLRS